MCVVGDLVDLIKVLRGQIMMGKKNRHKWKFPNIEEVYFFQDITSEDVEIYDHYTDHMHGKVTHIR